MKMTPTPTPTRFFRERRDGGEVDDGDTARSPPPSSTSTHRARRFEPSTQTWSHRRE